MKAICGFCEEPLEIHLAAFEDSCRGLSAEKLKIRFCSTECEEKWLEEEERIAQSAKFQQPARALKK